MTSIILPKPGERSAPGERLFSWLKKKKPGDIEYETNRFAKSKKKKIVNTTFVKHLDSGLEAVFLSYNLDHYVPLDKWMTTFQIKAFLKDECGYGSWDAIPQELQSKVFYPTAGVSPKAWDDDEDKSHRF